MAWFRRRTSSRGDDGVPSVPPSDPHPILPVLSRADVARLESVVQRAFAEHGIEAVPNGEGVLVGVDGVELGLSNIAAQASQTPRGDWPALAAGHAAGMVRAHQQPEATSLDEVRTQVYPRLRWAEDLPHRPSNARDALPGVVELIAIDYPSHVVELIDDDRIAALGDPSVLQRVALENLRALPPVEHLQVPADPDRDDAVVHVLTSEDFFGASRLVILDELMLRLSISPSAHGVLVAVPNRHLLVVHPVTGLGVIAALRMLTALASDQCEGQPGALSPYVYFRPEPGAAYQQVSHPEIDGQDAVRVEGPLHDAFVALGLLHDE